MTTHRIEALTDGVFAIAMTLLVLNLALPEARLGLTHADLITLLSGQTDKFFNYALSFILLAIFWIRHHQQSHYVKKTDMAYLWMNIIFLMFIVLIPFSTSLIGDYSNEPLAHVFFGSNILILGTLLMLNWHYATGHNRLIVHDVDPRIVSSSRKRGLVTITVSILAIGIAFLNTDISNYIYLLIPILQEVIRRRSRKSLANDL